MPCGPWVLHLKFESKAMRRASFNPFHVAKAYLIWVGPVVLALSLRILCNSASADDQLKFQHSELIDSIEALPVNEELRIQDFFLDRQISEVCLVSTDNRIEVVSNDCRVDTSSLVVSSHNQSCIEVDLSSLSARVLSGSIESSCHRMSSNLSIVKVERYGHLHIILNSAEQK